MSVISAHMPTSSPNGYSNSSTPLPFRVAESLRRSRPTPAPKEGPFSCIWRYVFDPGARKHTMPTARGGAGIKTHEAASGTHAALASNPKD